MVCNISILLIFSYILFSITTKIRHIGEKAWAIVHPILYFTIILEFLDF